MAVETLAAGAARTPRPRRPRLAVACAVLALVTGVTVVRAGVTRTAGPSAGPDVTTARAVLDGLGVPLPGGQVSERVYRPCADAACAQVVRTFVPTGRPSLRTVAGEVDDWAAGQGLAGGGWVCAEPRAIEHTAAPVGDCFAGWLTSDGVEVDVHVRLAPGTVHWPWDRDDAHVEGGPWTRYADQPVLLVWDLAVASRPGED